MKKISILIPTYNEEENIELMAQELSKILKSFEKYTYEIIFIDNHSIDKTQALLENICNKNPNIKAIFNARNFGQFNSPYYGLLQTSGDCVITMSADFQDPLERIPDFIKEWEAGNKIVIGIKSKSLVNPVLHFLRTLFYKLIKYASDVEQIEHFTGFGLYDKDFIQVLRDLKDPQPYFRGIVSELGFKIKKIDFLQAKRRAGKSSNNFFKLYDAAMIGFVSYTKIGLRIASFIGFSGAIISLGIAMIYLFLKLMYWDTFTAGFAPIIIGLFLFNSVTLVFLGIIGEYIISINQRIMNRPLVIEEKRINF